jgi:fimbrial chaperone protein
MNWRKYLRATRFALPLLILAAPIPVWSLLVRPILIDMKASGSGTNSSFEVINDRNRSIAVEVAVQTLNIPERGETSLTPNDGAEFQIFPPIASIPAGKKQVFRVKWIGAPDLQQSKLYTFLTAELPVKREASESGSTVQIVYAINSVVAVAPTNRKPNIVIEKIDRVTSKDGKPGIEILFNNDSVAHGYVGNTEIELSVPGSDWKATVNNPKSGKAFGLGLIPANAKRFMFVPLEGVPATGDIKAELQPVLGRNRRAL